MSNAEKYVASKWLSGKDLSGREHVVRIFDVSEEPVKDRSGQNQDKLIVTFERIKKTLILNKTNVRALIALLGAETSGWVGKTVIVYPENGSMNGEQYVGLRIKAAVAKPATTPAEPPAMDEIGWDSLTIEEPATEPF